MKIILFTFFMLLALTTCEAQFGSQYATTYQTNVVLSALPCNATATNLTVFTSGASNRLVSVTIQNLATNPVYIIWGTYTNSGSLWTNGALRLATAGTVGDTKTYYNAIPLNGTPQGGTSIKLAAQAEVGVTNTTSKLQLEALGF